MFAAARATYRRSPLLSAVRAARPQAAVLYTFSQLCLERFRVHVTPRTAAVAAAAVLPAPAQRACVRAAAGAGLAAAAAAAARAASLDDDHRALDRDVKRLAREQRELLLAKGEARSSNSKPLRNGGAGGAVDLGKGLIRARAAVEEVRRFAPKAREPIAKKSDGDIRAVQARIQIFEKRLARARKSREGVEAKLQRAEEALQREKESLRRDRAAAHEHHETATSAAPSDAKPSSSAHGRERIASSPTMGSARAVMPYGTSENARRPGLENASAGARESTPQSPGAAEAGREVRRSPPRAHFAPVGVPRPITLLPSRSSPSLLLRR